MQRSVELEGCHNFRDLGGYPTRAGGRLRWRMLFRSDALHHLTAADVARLRGEIGLGHVVDLRSSGEIAIDGRGRLAAESIRMHHLPLFDGAGTASADLGAQLTLSDRYFLMTEHAKRPIARVIQTLSEAEAPAVYHCAAGKDRTGVVSAVLLGLLGVADEIIVADYAATQQNLDAIIARLMASEGYQGMLENLPPDTLHAEPQTMISLLERVGEKYGSMRGYVREIGVPDDAVERLERRLLE
ncbi:MAG TPA: tyrosine-protein phosphatase [Myxococcota bacterium]|jgi:protein-tyrosine phosphatase